MMKTIILATCLTISFFQFQAQTISKQVIGNSGQSMSNETYTINFTVGEPIIGRVQNSAAIHQGFWSEVFNDDTLSVSIVHNEDVISIFPNPVVSHLNFHFKQNIPATYIVKLFDIHGKQVVNTKVQSQSQNTQLDMSQLSNGMYLLTIESKEINYIKSFKIIKK